MSTSLASRFITEALLPLLRAFENWWAVVIAVDWASTVAVRLRQVSRIVFGRKGLLKFVGGGSDY